MNLRFLSGAFAASTLALAAFAWPGAATAQGASRTVVTTPQVRAELMAWAPQGVVAEPALAAAAGAGASSAAPVWVGLQIAHKPEWHTYWKNSGDSGLPTTLEWSLPPGVIAGDIDWPIPKKIPIGSLANYGYEGTVLLPVPLTITPDFKPPIGSNALQVKLKAAWLVCRLECIPEEGEFALSIPIRGSTALNGAAFEAAFKATPKPVLSYEGVRPDSTIRIDGQRLQVSVQGLPVELRGKALGFFPETPEVIETAAPYEQAWKGAVWTASVPIAAQRANGPSVMPVVLTEGGQGWRAELKVLGEWPKVAAAATVSPALEAALQANASANPAGGAPQGPSLTLLAALVGALIGGLILNLMPCVFPVLAIKVMGFTRHADNHRAHRISGLAYTAGVIVSFMALGALLLALRAAGESLGWGFQLQNPWVVATLAALFTVIGLNLAGLFEFGSFLPSSVASLQARHPVVDSFLTGVLAVAVASPCTAPFMGASLGFAVGLPAAQALAVFAAIGLGLALPYLAASFVPAVANLLPRPGPWMETFRRLMAFPMFATVVWLVWVLGQQSGIDGAGALLMLLVAGAFVLWSLTLNGRARNTFTLISIAGLVLLTLGIGRNVGKLTENSPVGVATTERWQPWAPGKVEALLAGGHPVFVDFTAAWCVTCQYNKKTTLADPAVLADLDAKKVQLLRADWTRRDPAITAALAQLGRNGVPVYVLYQSGRAPQVLSEVLSVQEVRDAVGRL
ncbi:MAG: thioredoxin family protein [Burkholderiaceae bacterium]|nr:thioredoxin family protein [Burkholderiaceae bacterium]